MGQPKKKKMELPYDPIIPLLHPEEAKARFQRDIYTLTFMAAAFTMVKR